MDADSIFSWTVVTLVIAQQLARFPRRRLVSLVASLPGMRQHRLDGVLLILTKVSVISVLLVYLLLPDTIAWMSIGLPAAIRILGGVFGVAGVALLRWADQTLAENLSVSLQIKEGHTLVTTGPYSRVRHPVYTATLMFFVGIGLLASNWLVAAVCVGTITCFYALRIPVEEQMMLDHFGDRYRQYRRGTGRLLPPIKLFSDPKQ